MPEVLASFRGRVSGQRAPGPLGLALAGVTAEHPQQRTTLEFAAPAPLELPATPARPMNVQGEAAGSYWKAESPEPTFGLSNPESARLPELATTLKLPDAADDWLAAVAKSV